MSHPLTDEAIDHIEKSWSLMKTFGLCKAEVMLFKRFV